MLRLAGRLGEEDRHRHDADREVPDGQPRLQRSTVHGVLRDSGRPLDEATRTEMENRLGADFTDVHIHDDAAAKAFAAEVGARAYTSGSHVVIGHGGGDDHTLAQNSPTSSSNAGAGCPAPTTATG
ncbi:DUF4157 domain-containing protein [Streptomyces sp. NPDC056061]|uniref:eCIS core domain-containing protein n=1 Tax=Streptomyces sp. NPDC056061 TaxID=3345700 RepID=UPI0035DB63B8